MSMLGTVLHFGLNLDKAWRWLVGSNHPAENQEAALMASRYAVKLGTGLTAAFQDKVAVALLHSSVVEVVCLVAYCLVNTLGGHLQT